MQHQGNDSTRRKIQNFQFEYGSGIRQLVSRCQGTELFSSLALISMEATSNVEKYLSLIEGCRRTAGLGEMSQRNALKLDNYFGR